jgi:hypothetical protein
VLRAAGHGPYSGTGQARVLSAGSRGQHRVLDLVQSDDPRLPWQAQMLEAMQRVRECGSISDPGCGNRSGLGRSVPSGQEPAMAGPALFQSADGTSLLAGKARTFDRDAWSWLPLFWGRSFRGAVWGANAASPSCPGASLR